MKYISIYPQDTLVSLSDRVGVDNVDQIIADNGLKRVPNIGKQWKEKCENIIETSEDVTYQRKITILNSLIENSDVYEQAALSDDKTWKVLSALNTFPEYLKVSDRLQDSIPDSYQVLGNKQPVSSDIYGKVNDSLLSESHSIDSSIFRTYSTMNDVGLVDNTTYSDSTTNPLSWFNIPEGDVVLYSSLSGESVNIPAYPESPSDSRSANYINMPDLIYHYEPWQLYQGSGPRSNSYKFHLHRDMWTGDHSDGKANELIRFCQAQCYPQYNGSALNASTVTLYVGGNAVITGIMTRVNVDWDGPIGLDNWHLEFTLTLDITEVSSSALDYDTILSKPLIG